MQCEIAAKNHQPPPCAASWLEPPFWPAQKGPSCEGCPRGCIPAMAAPLDGGVCTLWRARAASASFAASWAAPRIAEHFGSGTRPCPTMAAAFCNRPHRHGGHRLLIGSEAGEVVLVNCAAAAAAAATTFAVVASPAETIWDVAWSPTDETYALGLADDSVHIYSVARQAATAALPFHQSSVRTVKYQPAAAGAILASSGRDGAIALWDLRLADAAGSGGTRPVAVVANAHAEGCASGRPSASPSSVTAIEFLPGEPHVIASVGQPDYSIRFWDMRYTWRRGTTPVPVDQIDAPLSGLRRRAFLALSTDSTGSTIYATNGNNRIYSYLTSNRSPTPLECFSAPGFRSSASFYVRSAVSPDDAYLLSGSNEGGAYVWPLFAHHRRRRRNDNGDRHGWRSLAGCSARKFPFDDLPLPVVEVTEACLLGEHRYDVSCVAWSKGSGSLTASQRRATAATADQNPFFPQPGREEEDGDLCDAAAEYIFVGGEDYVSRLWSSRREDGLHKGSARQPCGRHGEEHLVRPAIVCDDHGNGAAEGTPSVRHPVGHRVRSLAIEPGAPEQHGTAHQPITIYNKALCEWPHYAEQPKRILGEADAPPPFLLRSAASSPHRTMKNPPPPSSDHHGTPSRKRQSVLDAYFPSSPSAKAAGIGEGCRRALVASKVELIHPASLLSSQLDDESYSGDENRHPLEGDITGARQ